MQHDHEPQPNSIAPSRRLKSFAVLCVKVALAALIFAFLYSKVDRESFAKLASEPKRWDMLVIALAWVLIAHLLTYIRWWQLVRSLGVEFPLRTAIRAGFLGTAFNLVSFGAVGGDLFKAIIASRSAPKKIPEVIASIVVDRVAGLMGLIIVTCVSVESYARMQADQNIKLPLNLQLIRQYAWFGSIASLIALVIAVTAGKYLPAQVFRKLPWVGGIAVRMAEAARQFHGRPILVLTQVLASCGVHIGLTLGFYTTAIALTQTAPNLITFLITIPPSFAVAALPLLPGGVGVFEAAVAEFMNSAIGKDAAFMKVIIPVGFTYRLLLLIMAAIGGVYYLLGFGKLAKNEHQLASELSRAEVLTPTS
jgi:glycosyltransferase 2 family protein